MSSQQKISLLLLLIIFSFLLAQRINLTTADLGRHLKNGELFFKQSLIANTNLYSYTYPTHSFINHHWGSGAIFYLIQQLAGFAGLSLFFMALSLMTFLVFFKIAWQYSSFSKAFFISIILLPLMTARREIRPEVFSYLFSGLFFWLLYHYQHNKISARYLFFLPLAELLWVNLHLYFPLGLFLIAVFLLPNMTSFISKQQENRRRKIKKLGLLLTITSLVTLLNPNGLSGALYPLRIFDNFGYRLVENQSLFFIEKISSYPAGIYFKIALVLVTISWIYSLITHWQQKSTFPLTKFLISLAFTILALKAIRNFSIFAYFSLPITAINFRHLKFKKFAKHQNDLFVPAIIVLATVLVLINLSYWQNQGNKGLGLQTNSFGPIAFFQKENLRGPIFNNYDIGSYLIYFLYPKEKVFVDNRPEAYPADFFNQIYVPLQENKAKWQEGENIYHFQTIFFYRHDLTPWAQGFLIRRVSDSAWAPVFVDENTIIFLKRNGPNQETIDKYELPPEIFKVNQLG